VPYFFRLVFRIWVDLVVSVGSRLIRSVGLNQFNRSVFLSGARFNRLVFLIGRVFSVPPGVRLVRSGPSWFGRLVDSSCGDKPHRLLCERGLIRWG